MLGIIVPNFILEFVKSERYEEIGLLIINIKKKGQIIIRKSIK
jgi:hypothetical protein